MVTVADKDKRLHEKTKTIPLRAGPPTSLLLASKSLHLKTFKATQEASLHPLMQVCRWV